jgi:uncharacterized protein
MGLDRVALILFGAFAGGFVNGLTGFGTGITAMGIWLYAMPPTAAASLSVLTGAMAQLQTLRMIWPAIRWRRVLPFVVPGIFGVPLGTLMLTHIDPKFFKLGLGAFLIVYPLYVLARRSAVEYAWGGRFADGAVGFGGGFVSGLTGLVGVLIIVWTDLRGWTKEQRRGIVQAFNIVILAFTIASHAASGLLTRQLLLDAAVTLPATIVGARLGAFVYLRLGDRGYQRAVMLLLLVSGAALIWTNR